MKIGQLIGEAVGNFSCNIHSSVNGKVSSVIDIQTASGKNSKAVVIDTEGYDQEINYERKDVTNLTKEKIVEAMKENGLVGMGGASFPAHIKYSPNKPIDTVIINGAECEPYVTCDDFILKTKPEVIVDALELLVKAVDAKKELLQSKITNQKQSKKLKRH